MNKTKKKLNDISQIKFGYYTQPEDKGEISYLQVRQFDELGMMVNQSDEYLNIDQKSESHILKDGDVLFVGKVTACLPGVIAIRSDLPLLLPFSLSFHLMPQLLILNTWLLS